MSAKNVLFIGAGASFGARLRNGKTPPLGNDLVQWLRCNLPKLRDSPYLNEATAKINQAIALLETHNIITNFEILLKETTTTRGYCFKRLFKFSFLT